MGPHSAVAQIRLAVRRSLRELAASELAAAEFSAAGFSAAELAAGQLVLAACSGGADSLALAAAVAFEAPALGLRAGGVTVDHGLQAGSAEQAARVTGVLTGLGLDPVHSIRVAVAGPGSGAGPEAAARKARYAALDEYASATGAAAILLGHTMDDQAETVLLGLARGSGARSLAGMASRNGRYLRPLLGIGRAQTLAACAAAGLQPWQDPHNSDPAYARARVRSRILPVMEELLGPGIADALARSADQLRADADALDSIASAEAARLSASDRGAAASDRGLGAEALRALPAAIRTRVLRDAAIAAGCPAGALSARHVGEMDALVMLWRGQRWTDLPGGVRCQRRCGRLIFTAGA